MVNGGVQADNGIDHCVKAYCWLSEAGGTGYFMAVLIKVSFRDVVMA